VGSSKKLFQLLVTLKHLQYILFIYSIILQQKHLNQNLKCKTKFYSENAENGNSRPLKFGIFCGNMPQTPSSYSGIQLAVLFIAFVFMWLFPHVSCTIGLLIGLWIASRSKRNKFVHKTWDITFICACRAKTGTHGNQSMETMVTRPLRRNAINSKGYIIAWLDNWPWCAYKGLFIWAEVIPVSEKTFRLAK
jgi:hypothetical protein